MRLDNSFDQPYMEGAEDENPLLGWTAFGVEIGGGITAWALNAQLPGLKEKRDVFASRTKRARGGMKAALEDRSGFTSAGSSGGSYSSPDAKRVQYFREQQGKGIVGVRKYGRRYSSFKKISGNLGRTAKFLGVASIAALGFEMAGGLFSMADNYRVSKQTLRESSSPSYQDTSYYDSRRAMTQRQRAIQTIHSSQLSTRAAFGMEASYLHK